MAYYTQQKKLRRRKGNGDGSITISDLISSRQADRTLKRLVAVVRIHILVSLSNLARGTGSFRPTCKVTSLLKNVTLGKIQGSNQKCLKRTAFFLQEAKRQYHCTRCWVTPEATHAEHRKELQGHYAQLAQIPHSLVIIWSSQQK